MIGAGFKTTEFWMSVAGFLVAAVVIVFSLPADMGADLQTTVAKAVTAAVALAGQVYLVVNYIHGRSNIKALQQTVPPDENPLR